MSADKQVKPVSQARQGEETGKGQMLSMRLRQTLHAVLAALSCYPAASMAQPPAGELPQAAADFLVSGQVDNPVVNGRTMNITQRADALTGVSKAVVKWDSFNVGKDATVNFIQPGRDALILNRIGQADQSQIYGSINANGGIYLLNQNGILFGKGSEVNVHSLIASSLNIEDELFENGILSALDDGAGSAALVPYAAGESGDVLIDTGATIKTKSGGRVLIAAPNVENRGTIKSPDGQVLLAAGQKVYLAPSEDPDLRGILIEVDNGGTASNLGSIVSKRGNITLAGLAVNQQGRLTATTSVNSNGSIRLQARDTVSITSGTPNTMSATRGGSVITGKDSVIRVNAETGDKATAVDSQQQYASSVDISGKTVHLKAGSRIKARGGVVNISAVANQKQANEATDSIARNDEVRVHMDKNASIDVSGYSTTLDMSRNELEVELRGNELQDLPLQRDGVLRGETVTIDIRRADQFQLGNIDSALGTVQRGVAERNSAGGSVNISSEGEIRLMGGAGIDVSGGVISYREGSINSTWLYSGNEVFDINSAPADRIYNGIFEQQQVGYETAYKHGQDAGSIQLIARGMILDATLTGEVTVGRYQRSADTAPKGGQLVLGLADGQGLDDYIAPNVTLARKNLSELLGGFALGADEKMSDVAELATQANNLRLSDRFIRDGGFTRVAINSNGEVRIRTGSALDLGPAGELTVQARRVDIGDSIKAAGGNLDVAAVLVDDEFRVSDAVEGISVDNNVLLDVSGNWVNRDTFISGGESTAVSVLDAGTISLQTGEPDSELTLGNNLGLVALGGAGLSADGDLSYGDGGNISLITGDQNSSISLGRNTLLLGHGFDQGGRLELTANRISVRDQKAGNWQQGQNVASGETLIVPDLMFSEAGFSSVSLTSNQGNLEIESGAEISLTQSSLFLPTSALTRQSGSLETILSDRSSSFTREQLSRLRSGWLDAATGSMSWIADSRAFGFAEIHRQNAVDLDLAVAAVSGNSRHQLRLQDGAQIIAAPQAQINFNNATGGLIEIAGDIDARGGSLSLLLDRQDNQAFSEDTAVVIADSASINLGADIIDVPDLFGYRTARVIDAGELRVSSDGSVILEQGASVQADGMTRSIDVADPLQEGASRYRRVAASGKAGSVSITAAEQIVTDGRVSLRPGSGAANSGGSLELIMSRGIRGNITGFSGFSDTSTIQVSQDVLLDEASGEPVGPEQGYAKVTSDWLAATGADRVYLRNEDEAISFVGDVTLDSARLELVLDGGQFISDGGQISIDSNYIAIGEENVSNAASGLTPNALAGGSLHASANHIDLSGASVWQGFESIDLVSRGDLRLKTDGELLLEGDLNLRADQVYVATNTDFSIDAGDAGSITILGGSTPGTILSAAGSIEMHAGSITQSGVLRAPGGSIQLNAENELRLADGSETSVSLDDRQVLLGKIVNETRWLHNDNGNDTSGVLYSGEVQALTDKELILDAASVVIDDGATVDLSGGGETLTWEFIPGPGGSQDFLLAESAGSFFAVLPGLDTIAAHDLQESLGWDFDAGESVYLSDSGILKAGNYIKLPARYALLEGAYLVEAVDGFDNLQMGSLLNVGSQSGDNGNYAVNLVAGYNTIDGTSFRDSGTSGFIVRKGSYAHELGEFNLRSADDFVRKIARDNDLTLPRLDRDAGRLSISGRDEIVLDGDIRSAASAGARGALVDISSDSLSVVSERSGGAGVELLESNLGRLDVESLLLGGRRSDTQQGTEIEVSSSDVTIREGVSLQATELLLVAKDTVQVETGARLSGSGQSGTRNETLLLEGDNALLAVSATENLTVVRSDNPASAGAGEVIVESDVTLAADNNIIIDGTGDVASDADIDMTGGRLSLGASLISLGDIDGDPEGLVLTDEKLQQLQGLDLLLRSGSSIDIYGTAELSLEALQISAAGLRGLNGVGSVPVEAVISAGQMTLANPDAVAMTAAAGTPAGSLSLIADALTLSSGEFGLQDFATTTASVAGTTLLADSGSLIANGDLTLDTAGITAASGVRYQVNVAGQASFINSTDATMMTATAGIGASLDVIADDILFDTAARLNSGYIGLLATGHDVVLGSDADLDVSGVRIAAVTPIELSGGSISLESVQGDIRVTDGSRMDLRGGGDSASAGALGLTAGSGSVSLAGEQLAGASEATAGGQVSIDAVEFADGFQQLAGQLEAGGFTGAQHLRLRQGDITVAETDSLQAQSLSLTADEGSISVAGSLQTPGADGGEIGLFAAGDIDVAASARILARATDNGGEGGQVSLMSREGQINLLESSSSDEHGIHVGGLDAVGERISDGRVYLRTSRTAANDHVNINRGEGTTRAIATTISGAERIDIEAVKTEQGVSSIGDAQIDAYEADAAAFMANSDDIYTDLGVAADQAYQLQAGIEVRSTGDLTLNSDWDTSDLRYTSALRDEDATGVISLIAAGDLTLNGSLTDGMRESDLIAGQQVMIDDRSWSYRLVAGSDDSASPLATGETLQNLTLTAGNIIRTGTGDIEVASSGDIILADHSSTIYSLGRSGGYELDARKSDVAANQWSFAVPVGQRVSSKLLPVDGGDVTLLAGNDIRVDDEDPTQLFVEWFKRQASSEGRSFGFQVFSVDEDAGTWIDVNSFEQGVAAMGGGDISVMAGNDITRLSVSAPTTISEDFTTGELTRLGAGDIHVSAGGDINGGAFLLGDGQAVIRAGGDIVGGRETSAGTMETVFALMGGQYDVQSGGDLAIETIYNPTTVNPKSSDMPLFVSYTEQSAINMSSLAGDLSLAPGTAALDAGTLTDFDDNNPAFNFLPGSVRLSAVQGGLTIEDGSLTMAPSASGDLNLYAQETVATSGATIVMSDADPEQLPSVAEAASNLVNLFRPLDNQPILPLHAGDSQGSWVMSADADIDGGIFQIPEQMSFIAGRDILDVKLSGLNIDTADVTRLVAGRDIVQTTGSTVISVAGPGRLEVVAGRNVDLGESAGIETVGDLVDSILNDSGADIYIQAGVGDGPDYAGFYQHYFVDGEELELADYLDRSYSQQLDAFLDGYFTSNQERTEFAALSAEQQWAQIKEDFLPILTDAFYEELYWGGNTFDSDAGRDYSRGFDAIASLFPDADYSGDLRLYASRIYTLDGGDINLMVPGGLINAGQTVATGAAALKANDPSKLGVVAQSSGSVRSFSDGDFQVNQSRVMTLAGGNILLWSSYGDLDAGRGKKTSVAAPAPRISVNDNGEVTVDLSNTISGSGIQSIVTDPSIEAGSVDLIAPNGTVNAGDAGIIASGNINIAAERVIGADNIQFGGVAVGVPSANTGSVSTGGLGSVGSVASSVSKAAEDSAAAQGSQDNQSDQFADQPQLSFLSVEVIGFGEDEEQEDEA